MLILLPPSREKSAAASRVPWHRGSLGSGPLAAARRQVVDAAKGVLRSARGDESAIGRLLDATGGAIAPAQAALAQIDERPTAAYLDRYTGILYRVLRGEDWPAALDDRARRQIAVSSALWGVVTGRDAIPDARLNIGASLPELRTGLGTWWRDRTGALLDPLARERVVVDLRSSGYDRTWVAPDDARGVVTARFLTAAGDRNEPSAFGKQRKGALARALLEADLPDDAALADVIDAAATMLDGSRLDRRASRLGDTRADLTFRAR